MTAFFWSLRGVFEKPEGFLGCCGAWVCLLRVFGAKRHFFVTEGFFGECEVDFLGAKECFWGPRGVLAALRDVF